MSKHKLSSYYAYYHNQTHFKLYSFRFQCRREVFLESVNNLIIIAAVFLQLNATGRLPVLASGHRSRAGRFDWKQIRFDSAEFRFDSIDYCCITRVVNFPEIFPKMSLNISKNVKNFYSNLQICMETVLKTSFFPEKCIKLKHKLVCQEHAYFIAPLCNAGLGNSWLTYVINKFPEISELTILLWLRSFMNCGMHCQLNVRAKLLTIISLGLAVNVQWCKYESKKTFH